MYVCVCVCVCVCVFVCVCMCAPEVRRPGGVIAEGADEEVEPVPGLPWKAVPSPALGRGAKAGMSRLMAEH